VHEEEEEASKFSDLSESKVCAKEFWERFAYFLMHDYKAKGNRNNDKQIQFSSAELTLRKLMHIAKEKFYDTGTLATKLFFTCLDQNSQAEHATWLKGVIKNMKRVWVSRIKVSAEETDFSAPPLYAEDLKKIIVQYSREGSADAARRKFVLLGCWANGGRSGEPGWISIDCATWDPFFEALIVKAPTPKAAKLKMGAMISSRSPELCFFLSFFDELVMNKRPVTEDFEPDWLFPNMQQGGGKKAGEFIKALLPQPRGAKAFKDYAVDTLPSDVSAASFRVGCINTLACHVPCEIGVHVTGHDCLSMSAWYNYFKLVLPHIICALKVLFGWLPPPWGTIGPPTKAASLAPIVDSGVDQARLRKMILDLLQLDDSSPIELRPGGELWPFIEHVFATGVKDYEERSANGHMRWVQRKMVDHLMAQFNINCTTTAHSLLIDWSRRVSAKFLEDNDQHINRADNRAIISKLTHLESRLDDVTAQLKTAITAINTLVHAAAVPMAVGGPPLPPAGPLAVVEQPPSTSTSTSPPPLPPAGPLAEVEQPPPTSTLTSPTSPLLPPAAPQAVPPAAARSSQSAFHRLRPYRESAKAPAQKGILATNYYVDYKQKKALPIFESRDQTRAKVTFLWFDNMATSAEKIKFNKRGANQGELRILAEHLKNLIIEYFHDAYEASGIKLPPCLDLKSSSTYEMKLSFISDRTRDLQAKKVKTGATILKPDSKVPDSKVLAAFREKARATKVAAERQAASSKQKKRRRSSSQ